MVGNSDRASGDDLGSISFLGSPTAEAFTREIRESLAGVLSHSLKLPPDEDAGFISASLPDRAWYGYMWTRDAGTFLRELVSYGLMDTASLTARYLMRMVRANSRGYLCYPMSFLPGQPASGDELDGTAAIIISLVLLWQRLGDGDPTKALIYDFLHQPPSPLRYFPAVLSASPLIPGHGEFGGGMGAEGLHMNAVQNGLCRLALLAGERLERAAGDESTAASYRATADRLSQNMRKYLVDSDGCWTWCVDAETLRPDPAVLGSYWNVEFGGINGCTSMQSDVLGFDTTATGWDGTEPGRRTLEKLASAPIRKRLLERYGMWTQFGSPPYDHLTSPSYGQGYAIQCALLLDDMARAGRMLDYLVDATLNPPAGYKLDRDSRYWFYEQCLAPEFPDIANHNQGCGALNLVNVAEPMKAARIVTGIDDLASAALIIPRVPSGWSGYRVENWPVLTSSGVVRIDAQFSREDGRERLVLNVHGGRAIPHLSVKLGEGLRRDALVLHDVNQVEVSYEPGSGYSLS